MGDIVTKYSDPLLCEKCMYALSPIGKFSRAKNVVCAKYLSKPSGVLFNNEKCPNYDGAVMATDGGPGSGNFGHKGRPGLVGGSGKGGGAQYRGGRKDIGYFGSRKDWLNGLSGEEQHKAARFLASKKRDLQQVLKRKETLRRVTPSPEEAENIIKRSGLAEFNEDTPVEEFIMKRGSKEEIFQLMSMLQNARNWDTYKDRYISENLSDDEKKIIDYLGNKDISGEEKDLFYRLQAKALGVPGMNTEAPDEVLYNSGVKERPVVETNGKNYDWVENAGYKLGNIAGYMGSAMNDPQWAKRHTRDTFEELNKKFVNHMKYERLSPGLCNSALYAISSMRLAVGPTNDGDFKVTPEMSARLDEMDKYRLLKIAGYAMSDPFSPIGGVEKIEDMGTPEFYEIESKLRHQKNRSKEEQQIVRDYVLIMNKMLTGEVPSETNPVEERKKAEKEEAKRKRDNWVKARDEEQKKFEESGGAKQKQGKVKKIRELTPEKIKEAEDLSNLVKDSGIMVEGCHFDVTPLVPRELYENAIKAYRDVIDRYPFLAGELGSFGQNRDGCIAACSKEGYEDNNDGEVMINFPKWKSAEGLMKTHKDGEQKNQFVKIDDDCPPGYADICHELGHALANWLHRQTIGAFTKVPVSSGGYIKRYYTDNEVATKLKKDTMKALGISTYEEIKNEVSEYAAASRLNKGASEWRVGTAADEFFAECFCELMCNSKPRRAAVEFGKQLDKFIKDNKITETTTSVTDSTKPRFATKS